MDGYVDLVFDLVVVAAALGLSNFGAAIGIGLAGVDTRLRWRVAIVFGLFEGTMPLLGLLLGHRVAGSLGPASALVGGGILIATGSYTIYQARHTKVERGPIQVGMAPLVITGAALSIDNLVIGFALGTHRGPVAQAAAVIAVVSVAMSLIGLELGARLGHTAQTWSTEIGGAVLIFVGLTVGTHLL